jgi:hypothetical protein
MEWLPIAEAVGLGLLALGGGGYVLKELGRRMGGGGTVDIQAEREEEARRQSSLSRGRD